ncbi:MAG: HD domain-containing protein [Gemmatimonadaceae bacterium]|nr:HD domain-containing protein [Gemmatimonadaceae bacterium]
MRFDIIRDPLWNNIRVDPVALHLIDTPAFQRLRYVRQLGLAHLVYPGATHSRFEHAVGTYHLARRAIAMLSERGDIDHLQDEMRIIAPAALLHDLGHYPFSHALEEIGALHHEDVAGPLITSGPVARILEAELGADAPARIHALVRGKSVSPLQGLISGSLDLDKIEYLKRDALMCGVPYGEIDVDRLMNSMAVVQDPADSMLKIGVMEKALSALESLLFAKYQMYRNVYWHHAVRSATSMYKRLVGDSLRAGALNGGELSSLTDEGLLHRLESSGNGLLAALRERRLYKRALEIPSNDIPDGQCEWIAEDYERVVKAEDAIANELGMKTGSVLLDYPAKTQMLGLDILVVRKSGRVERLTESGWPGTVNLPSLSEQLYRSTRWLRIFTKDRINSPNALRAAVERIVFRL